NPRCLTMNFSERRYRGVVVARPVYKIWKEAHPLHKWPEDLSDAANGICIQRYLHVALASSSGIALGPFTDLETGGPLPFPVIVPGRISWTPADTSVTSVQPEALPLAANLLHPDVSDLAYRVPQKPAAIVDEHRNRYGLRPFPIAGSDVAVEGVGAVGVSEAGCAPGRFQEKAGQHALPKTMALPRIVWSNPRRRRCAAIESP